MELTRLIAALSDPAVYPVTAEDVEVRQTHLSVVFLVDEYAYKIKKPLVLDFVDCGTLERRRHLCEEEVRLNRRLAPGVYLGAVPVALDGAVRVEGRGEIIEWAVKMRRLPESATLRERVNRGEVDAADLAEVARRLADFHARADAGPAISEHGRFAIVAANARANFVEAARHVIAAGSTNLERSPLDPAGRSGRMPASLLMTGTDAG